MGTPQGVWHSEELDTRVKIVGPEAALHTAKLRRAAIVSGYFDPLLVEHVRRLGEIRRGFDTLIVVLSNPPDPILSARARAELVAALETVDYVVLPVQQDWPANIFREEEADKTRFNELVEHVRRRHTPPLQ